MAKLIDILARDLNEFKARIVEQGKNGIVFNSENGRTIGLFELAEDLDISRVKFEEWQAAVDALNAPKIVEWDKGSLPPIGSVVEWDGCTFAPEDPKEKDLHIGDQVTIIAHLKDGDFEIAAFTFNPNIHNPSRGSIWVNQGSYGCFRPIRTAEQVAAEEREKTIADMMEVTSDGISCIGEDDALALYKAGYRKQ